MTEYDDLLGEARLKADVFTATAKDYIPKMYLALRNENSNLSPTDARDRIQKDCIGIWSRRTILVALPEEAKDPQKQESGRLGQKKRNSAAFSAAPERQREEIVIDAQGRVVEDNRPSTLLQDSKHGNSSINDIDVKKSKLRQLTSEIKSDTHDCSSCRELRIKVNELSGALTQTTKLSTADGLIQSGLDPRCDSPLVRAYPKENRDILEFEFYMLFGDLRLYMAPLYPKIGDAGKVWFSGQIDKNTGKVLFVTPGRIGES